MARSARGARRAICSSSTPICCTAPGRASSTARKQLCAASTAREHRRDVGQARLSQARTRAALGLERPQRHAVEARQALCGRGAPPPARPCASPPSSSSAWSQQRSREIDVVQDHHHRLGLARAPARPGGRAAPAGARGRDDSTVRRAGTTIRLLREQRRQGDAAALAAGQRAHVARFGAADVDRRERGARDREIVRAFPLPARQMRVPCRSAPSRAPSRRTRHCRPAAAGRAARAIVARRHLRRAAARRARSCRRPAARNPASVCSSVVLPAPLRPRIAQHCPGMTRRSRSRQTRHAPRCGPSRPRASQHRRRLMRGPARSRIRETPARRSAR